MTVDSGVTGMLSQSMCINAKRTTLLLLLLTATLAWTQADASEYLQDILKVRQQILDQCGNWQALKDHGVRVEDLRAKIREVGTTDKIHIEERVALADGVARSGKNIPATNEIFISSTFWEDARRMPVLKLGILLHEYLGLMGVEGTDDYRISNAVVNELRVLLVFASPSILYLDLLPTVRSRPRADLACMDMEGIWRDPSVNVFYEYILIEQPDCNSIRMRSVIEVEGKFLPARHQDTVDILQISGSRQLRLANSFVYLDDPVDHLIAYTASFTKESLVVDEEHFEGTCPLVHQTWTLRHSDRMTLQKSVSCPDGRVLNDKRSYVRVGSRQ